MASIVSVLNSLIETSKDGEKGFQAAATDTSNGDLRTIFLRRAQSCNTGAAELQQRVTAMGEQPDESGSVAGALHRGWLNLKSAIAGRSDLAILEECERGEDVAKAHYRKALEDPTLPADIREMVQRQYDGVVRNHDQIRDLRDQYRAKQTDAKAV